MLQKTKGGFYVLEKFAQIPHLLHGFSTIEFGNMQALENRRRFVQTVGLGPKRLVSAQQEHGKKILIVDSGTLNNQSEKIVADGLITRLKNVCLIIKTADCLPILLFDPKKEAIGLVHAGRRGISLKIHLRAIAKMESLGCKAEHLLVGLGPAICPRCYDRIDLAGLVVKDFQKLAIKKKNIEEAGICTFENRDFYSYRRGDNDRFATILCLI